MPGPVRYTEKGKVKKSAPRKYESGKGWSNISAEEQASPSVPPARKSRIRKATGPIGPQGFSRQSQRRSSILAEINRQQDTRKTNQEALGFVGDALAKVAKVITAEPQTDFEKGIEPLMMAIPQLGMLRGATVKGIPGLKSAVPARGAAKKAVSRREARAAKLAERPANRAKAREARRKYTGKKAQRRNERDFERSGIEDGEVMDPPWVGKPELKGRLDTMKALRNR
jgi:hypothetical protein